MSQPTQNSGPPTGPSGKPAEKIGAAFTEPEPDLSDSDSDLGMQLEPDSADASGSRAPVGVAPSAAKPAPAAASRPKLPPAVEAAIVAIYAEHGRQVARFYKPFDKAKKAGLKGGEAEAYLREVCIEFLGNDVEGRTPALLDMLKNAAFMRLLIDEAANRIEVAKAELLKAIDKKVAAAVSAALNPPAPATTKPAPKRRWWQFGGGAKAGKGAPAVKA